MRRLLIALLLAATLTTRFGEREVGFWEIAGGLGWSVTAIVVLPVWNPRRPQHWRDPADRWTGPGATLVLLPRPTRLRPRERP